MDLEQQLAAFKAEFARTAPVGRPALYEAKIEELRETLRWNNRALPGVNGDESWELPVPASYVIAPSEGVELAHIDVDYRYRLEPDAIIASLKSLRLT